MKRKLVLQGENPERILKLFVKNGFSLYDVKKTQKNTLLFSVRAKEYRKIFAFFQKVCYNKDGRIYESEKYALSGVGKTTAFRPLFFGLGVIIYLLVFLVSSPFVFSIKTVGGNRTEILEILEENGLSVFHKFDGEKRENAERKLLALDGVSFSSVQKVGSRLTVEVRYSPFYKKTERQPDLISTENGVVESVSALCGTASVKTGDEVKVGDTLIFGKITLDDGREIPVQAVGKVVVLCKVRYFGEFSTEQEAEASGILYADGEILSTSVEKTADGYFVELTVRKVIATGK